jgi:hypothetical protein
MPTNETPWKFSRQGQTVVVLANYLAGGIGPPWVWSPAMAAASERRARRLNPVPSRVTGTPTTSRQSRPRRHHRPPLDRWELMSPPPRRPKRTPPAPPLLLCCCCCCGRATAQPAAPPPCPTAQNPAAIDSQSRAALRPGESQPRCRCPRVAAVVAPLRCRRPCARARRRRGVLPHLAATGSAGGALRRGARPTPRQGSLHPTRLVIEPRRASTPLAFAGQLQPRRPNG